VCVQGYLDLPDRAGHLNEVNKFDAHFFKYNKPQTDGLDVQTRLLLECTFEAIQDAKLSLKELNGSNTGVYMYVCMCVCVCVCIYV